MADDPARERVPHLLAYVDLCLETDLAALTEWERHFTAALTGN